MKDTPKKHKMLLYHPIYEEIIQSFFVSVVVLAALTDIQICIQLQRIPNRNGFGHIFLCSLNNNNMMIHNMSDIAMSV